MYSQQLAKLKINSDSSTNRSRIIDTLDNFCKKDDADRVKVKDAYAVYQTYCAENNYPLPSPQEFGSAMAKKFGLKTKNVRFGTEICRVFFSDLDRRH